MEYLPLSLTQCLEKHQDLPLQIKYSILLDVAKGLNYLHCKRPPIVHRDLTANNILLTSSFIAKISDLGVSRMADTFKRQQLTKAPGNAVVMPPEALKDNPSYDHKLDVFSYGCLILHVFTHQWPVPTDQYIPSKKIFRKGVFDVVSEWDRRSKYTIEIPSNNPFFSFTESCLENDPKKRPTMSNAIICAEHAFSNLPPIKNTMEMMKDINLLTKKLDLSERQKQEDILILGGKLEQLLIQVRGLEHEKKKAQESIHQLAKENENLFQKTHKLVEEKQQAQEDAQRLGKEKKQALDTASKEEEIRKRTEDLLQKEEKEKRRLTKCVGELEKKVQCIQSDKLQVMSDLTKSWQVKAISDVCLAVHEEEFAEKSKLLDFEMNRASRLEKEMLSMSKALSSSQTSEMLAKKELRQKVTELDEAKLKLSASNEENVHLESEITRLCEEITRLQSNMSSLQQSHSHLQSILKLNDKDIKVLRTQCKIRCPDRRVQKEIIEPLLQQELRKGDEW